MSVASNKKALQQALKFYEEFLKTVSEDVFTTTPPSGGWSYSEVYHHITSVNFISAIAAEKCLSKVAEIKTRKPDWRVRLILFLGKFPPGKIKAPATVEESVKKITKEEAANLIVKAHKKLEAFTPNFIQFDANYKMKHPRLGYLNAKHWLKFMVVHTNHHKKQIIGIQKDFVS